LATGRNADGSEGGDPDKTIFKVDYNDGQPASIVDFNLNEGVDFGTKSKI
jgi:hypothetical protein